MRKRANALLLPLTQARYAARSAGKKGSPIHSPTSSVTRRQVCAPIELAVPPSPNDPRQGVSGGRHAQRLFLDNGILDWANHLAHFALTLAKSSRLRIAYNRFHPGKSWQRRAIRSAARRPPSPRWRARSVRRPRGTIGSRKCEVLLAHVASG